jgi:SAM-dependent MidA family methyltransferase
MTSDSCTIKDSHLSEIIIQKIQEEGPISFCDFMQMALYYPEEGYYTSAKEKIGIEGDYYTSPVITPLFGTLLAKQLEEMWISLGRKEFTVVEFGAGTGSLCSDILNALQGNGELYDNLHYCIIEKNSAIQKNEKTLCNEKLSWHKSIQDISSFTGCILSNELIDNFPVHQVIMQDELMEVYVDYHNGFIETFRSASDSIKNYFEELQIVLPREFRTEVNLHATEWISEIACALKDGFVLTIDYGSSSRALYCNSKSSGTLVNYHKHSINFSPYTNIGKQDITSHVNFTALHHWGLKNGLALNGYTDQASFLLSLGLTSLLNEIESRKEKVLTEQQKMILLHTFLMDMGRKLKVLIQQKGIGNAQLSGLQFATKHVS